LLSDERSEHASVHKVGAFAGQFATHPKDSPTGPQIGVAPLQIVVQEPQCDAAVASVSHPSLGFVEQ
jgi:hypothetical protein